MLNRSEDLKGALIHVLDYILSVLNRIDRGFILFVNDEDGEIFEVVSSAKEDLQSKPEFSQDVVNRVIEKGEAVMIPDIHRADDKCFSDTLKLSRIKSVLCVPLLGKDHTLGVIYLDSINNAPGFRKEDFSLLHILSDPLALALENTLIH